MLALGLNSFAQSADALQSTVKQNKAITIFEQSIGDQSWLYNGTEYYPLRKLKTNSNFKDVTSTSAGGVVYNGYSYTNIPILYDIERQLVVTTWNDGESLYSLNSKKVSSFNVHGHHFVRLDSTAVGSPGSGFYDVLYNGKVQVLAQRIKKLNLVKGIKSADDFYEYKVRYYLKKGNSYYSVSGRADLINTLTGHDKELKKFVSEHGITFTEPDMVQLAIYYDSL